MCDIALELFIIDIQSFRAYKILKLIRYPSHRLHINPMWSLSRFKFRKSFA